MWGSSSTLWYVDGRHRSCECMADILDVWYLCTGQVVIGIAVGGAAFTAAGRKRYAAIARWVAEQGISVPWTLLLSMGNDVYQREPSKDINRSKVKAICCCQYALAKTMVDVGLKALTALYVCCAIMIS